MQPQSEAKLLILVLSANRDPWRKIQEQGQDKTWLASISKDVLPMRYIGNDGPPKFGLRYSIFLKAIQHWAYLTFSVIPGLRILARLALLRMGDSCIRKTYGTEKGRKSLATKDTQEPGSEALPVLVFNSFEHGTLIGLKTLAAYRHALENYTFEYLFRTNSSSYVDSHLLARLIHSFPKENVYAGVPGKWLGGRVFASGAGVLMSRDVVARVVDNEKNWRHGLIDDAALADLVLGFTDPPVGLTPLARVDFQSLLEAKEAPTSLIENSIHFRCKSEDAQETIEIMRFIHSVKRGHSG